MKINTIFYFLLFAFVLVSCGGDPEMEEEEIEVEEMKDASFFAKKDGVSIPFTRIQGLLTNDVLLISGSTPNVEQIVQIYMDVDVTPGTYPADAFPSCQYGETLDIWVGNSGSYTITTHDTDTHLIEGTFKYTAEDPTGTLPEVSITDGSFTSYY